MTEKTANNRKKYLVMLSATLGTALLICTVVSFPVIKFYGQTVWLFAPERLARSYLIGGRVLGDHVFETEYGEIRLKHSAYVVSDNGETINGIDTDASEDGLATHNLVIEGIRIPPDIHISLRSDPNRIFILVLENDEITVSGLPANVDKIYINSPNHDAGLVIEFRKAGYINLPGSTQIYFNPTTIGKTMLRSLYMYKDDKIWKIKGRISVKLPHETEFTEYRSITFGENWGGFIEGELFVPEDPEVERERMDKMLNDLSNSISIYGSRN